jgi:hypothetical protein
MMTEESKEKIRLYQKEYRERNKERLNEYYRKYSEGNADKLKERSRLSSKKYYLTHTEDCNRRSIEWQHNNRERRNEIQRSFMQRHKSEPKVRVVLTNYEKKLSRQITIKKYYDSHKDEIRRRANAWRLRNRQKFILYCVKRRFRKTNNGVFKVTDGDINRQLNRQNGECFWCNKKLENYHMDHVIPLCKGGRHSVGNIVISCPECNWSKSDKLSVEFKLIRELSFN